MIDMTITVSCDTCDKEMHIDLDDGSPFDAYEIKIEKAMLKSGWYQNLDGEWCPKCAPKARQKWLAAR